MANNANGTGGFGYNPGNRNNNGRPPKGYSITDMMRKLVASKVKDKKTGEMVEIREALGKSIIAKALAGDTTAQKLVWSYMDGMPIQTTDLTSGGRPLNTMSPETLEKMDKMYEKNADPNS
jgi:hypothetical protein